MKKMHVVLDTITGQAKARGKSGRWYTQREIDRARDAERGADDSEGAAFAADLDRSDWADVDMTQALLDEMHDCPECRAAMAAGVRPEIVTLAKQMMTNARQRRTRRVRVRRWREQKRRA